MSKYIISVSFSSDKPPGDGADDSSDSSDAFFAATARALIRGRTIVRPSARSVTTGLDSLSTFFDVAEVVGSEPVARRLVVSPTNFRSRISAAKTLASAVVRNALAGAALFSVYESVVGSCAQLVPSLAPVAVISCGAGAIAGATGGVCSHALEVASRASKRGGLFAWKAAASRILCGSSAAALSGAVEWSVGFGSLSLARSALITEDSLKGDALSVEAMLGVLAISCIGGAAQSTAAAIWGRSPWTTAIRALPSAAIGYAALEMGRYA